MSQPKPKPMAAAGGLADYDLAEQVGFLLRRATQRHLAIFSDHIPDMTPPQFAALAMLNALGAQSQNQLGRETAMDAATIKGVIDRLRKRGLVTTEPDPGDQRRIVVQLSEDGQRAFMGYVAAAKAITEETLAPLDARERGMLLGLLEKLT
jgi:DNA-binding MarR family transcriptional regulator